MHVVLSTYDSRGGVEPLAALAVRLRELGAEAQVCAPPDCAERLAELEVPFVPIGASVRELVHGATAPSPAEVPRRAAMILADQFSKLAAVAQGCDAIVTSGVVPAVAGARSVAEKLGVPSILANYCPIFLPSPHQPPQPMPGHPLPPGETDQRVLREHEKRSYNALFAEMVNSHRTTFGLPPVDDVHALVYTGNPWIAADPVLAPWPDDAAPGVVQTGAWSLPDDRPLPAELEEFVDAGAPPVYVGFGSMRAPADFARIAIEAARAHGRRVVLARSWAGFSPSDDEPDCLVIGEVNQQALFPRCAAVVHHGGAGTTHTAATAGTAQVVVPQMADQPYWASRVADLGIGAAHDGPTPTVETLAGALGAALPEAVRERARTVAGTMRGDGATVAAQRLVNGVT